MAARDAADLFGASPPVKLVVTGARGLLGTEVVADGVHRGWIVVGLGREDLDVTDAAAVEARLERERPDWVVHCAAFAAVDRAEAEPDEAMRVNRDGAALTARAAAAVGARTVYVSTDYVFDGGKRTPYRPDDPVRPLSAYGRSKAEGERAVSAVAGSLVVRTCWLYGAARTNFVEAMIGRARRGEALTVVEDERGRPTWARNAAVAILDLVERGVRGVWHVADGGEASRLELVEAALRLRGLPTELGATSQAEWGAPAVRPQYSVLDVEATERLLGREMEPWPEALERYLADVTPRPDNRPE